MAEAFRIAEGYVEIETRVAGDKITRSAGSAGDKAGDEIGRHFFQRFKKKVDDESKTSRTGFFANLGKNLFRRDPDLMRGLLHPIENFFARPVAIAAGAALVGYLVEALSAAFSSAVLLAIGGGVLAAGAAVLLGNEKLSKKLQQQNETRVRKETSLELSGLRTQLRARLTSMKRAGASDEEIRKVREAGEAHIAQVALANQKKVAAAAKASSQTFTQFVTDAGQKVMDVLTRAAQPLVGPFQKGIKTLVTWIGKMEPQFQRIFAAAAPIVPLLVDTFVSLAKATLPAIEKIMPAVVRMFEVLAARAPEIGDALANLILAFADPSTIEAFNLLLTAFIKSIELLTFLLPVLTRGFVRDTRNMEKAIHFVVDAFKLLDHIGHVVMDTTKQWSRNVVQWLGNVVDWFSKIPDWASEVANKVVGFFIDMRGRVFSFLQKLPGMLLDLFVEGVGALLGYLVVGTGKIVDFFVKLPGRIIFWVAKTWDDAYSATSRGIGLLVDFVARLPGRVINFIVSTWRGALSATVTGMIKLVQFVATLPDKIFTALVNLAVKLVGRAREGWGAARTETGTQMNTLLKLVVNLPARIWAALVRLKDRLVNRFAEGWSGATGTSKAKVIEMINFVLGIPGRVFNALRALPGNLAKRAKDSWNSFLASTKERASAIVGYIAALPGRFLSALRSLPKLLLESGRQLLQGLLVGVQNRIKEIGGLGSWFKTNLVDPVIRAVKNFFGIKSPSTVFAGIGTNIVKGLWQGIAEHHPVSMVSKIFGSMPKALAKLVEKGIISIAGLPKKAMDALSSVWGAITGFFKGSGKVSGSLMSWIMQAISITGVPASWAGPLARRAMFESGGNPRAINLWDSNAAAGHPSMGLMQTIGPTFAAYAWDGLRDIYNPVHNLVAAIRYILSRYGSIFAIDPPVRGYRLGGRLPEDIFGYGQSGMAYRLHKGETVTPSNQTSIAHQGSINHYHFQPGSVVLDARMVKDMKSVIDLIMGLQNSAKQMGVTPIRVGV